MDPRVYNVAMATGVLMIGSGVSISMGMPSGLIATGFLLVALTLVAAFYGRRAR